MCRSPGAIQACPGLSAPPWIASLTLIADLDAKRSASIPVKSGGMCWTITIGTGKSAGKVEMMAARAFGPPVEVPIATIATEWRLGPDLSAFVERAAHSGRAFRGVRRSSAPCNGGRVPEFWESTQRIDRADSSGLPIWEGLVR